MKTAPTPLSAPIDRRILVWSAKYALDAVLFWTRVITMFRERVTDANGVVITIVYPNREESQITKVQVERMLASATNSFAHMIDLWSGGESNTMGGDIIPLLIEENSKLEKPPRKYKFSYHVRISPPGGNNTPPEENMGMDQDNIGPSRGTIRSRDDNIQEDDDLTRNTRRRTQVLQMS